MAVVPCHGGKSEIPADVAAFVERREACDHFRGEDPYDADRARFLAQRIRDYCRGTDEELRQLKARYSDHSAVMRLLARFEERIESPCAPTEIECRCRQALGERFPRWGFAVLSEEMRRVAASLGEDPTITYGDFDDDGRRDVAFLFDTVSGSDQMAIAACLSSVGAGEPLVIEEPYCADGITRVPKGETYYDLEHYTGREERYPRDVINAYCYEKASASYLFDSGSFRRIVDSD